MPRLSLFVVGFGRPDLLVQQKRLLDKYLKDEFEVCLVDNTPGDLQLKMQQVCSYNDIGYMRVPNGDGTHPSALNHAAVVADEVESEFWGTLDHDIFSTKRCTMIPKIKKGGFYGLGQTYKVGNLEYLWPGFCFWSREWLNGRIPDYDGIRGGTKAADGDCGSMLHALFTPEDWERRAVGTHGYDSIRDEDEHGLQSFGYEWIDDQWVHFTNASHWKTVPNPQDRDARLVSLLESF